ncbi:HDOD domain-containing protein [Cupriavidus pinatubonensis]|uniref:HDOD domain-containing protein n=1 Tax=Cupriavidus pinatubonensis TaxID=248026 RepID=UPI001C72BED4|nr:HDOD domain-containing protein [Cupriavidus pinatubonensis]QYY33266.1 HDOD domain-containing protein [Cupriavidus pinatubonensis]
MSKKQFLDQLWARMAQKGDFPTLQYCIDNVFKTLNSDLSVGEMASTVLSDFSLSQKVIRLANSAMYRSFGGEVTTVSRAIMVLGVDTITHLTLGVQVLDFFQGVAPNRPQAARALKQAIMAGEITRALNDARGILGGEEGVVCTLMHHVSRLLVIFYFPDEWDRIMALSADGAMSENDACREVIDISLDDLAKAAAFRWRLPALIADGMLGRELHEETVLETHADWLGAVASLSSDAAASILAEQPEEVVLEPLLTHAQKLGLEPSHVNVAIQQAGTLKASMARSEAPDTGVGSLPDDGGKPADTLTRLQHALAEIRQEGAGMTVSQLAPLVLESAMRALNFSHCFLMLLHPTNKRFGARLGFGEGMRDKLEKLSFEEGFVPDVFHFAMIAPKPLLIEDLRDKAVSHRVPRWYRDAMPDTRSVLLIPVKVRNRCVAMICGDWGATRIAGGLTDGELIAAGDLAGEIATAVLRSAPQR